VVVISFDPRETPTLAAGKKKSYLDRYNRPGAENGWHFLTGDEASIRKVTDAAGFYYQWDEKTQQFAHASGIMVTTPDGRLARYFFGIEYAPRDVKFALMEASSGRIGSVVDKLLLYCYHYDPATGGYGFVAMNTVRVGGVVTLVALVGFVVSALRRDRLKAV
jgi:protein SCO1/2